MLTAPISGIAEPLKKFNTGDTVFAGDTLVRIVPDAAAQLKAELSISNKDIAEIRIGMPITLKFAALPPAEYGRYRYENIYQKPCAKSKRIYRQFKSAGKNHPCGSQNHCINAGGVFYYRR